MLFRSKTQAGAPLYKIGTTNVSRTAESQFWSLTDPRTINPREFAQQFGIPRENMNFNFVIQGRLKSGAQALTRPAPGVGSNSGGSLEVVTHPNTVGIETFNMF